MNSHSDTLNFISQHTDLRPADVCAAAAESTCSNVIIGHMVFIDASGGRHLFSVHIKFMLSDAHAPTALLSSDG